MKPKIGFMGLGIMGTPMAANLLKAGYPVMVYNRSPEKAAPLVKQGAGLASHPKALARAADVVIAMVTGPEALQDLLWGPDGAGGAFNHSKVFINMSSVSPGYTRELARELESTGVTFIDAPVSGTKKPAEDGTLIILAGGPRDKVEELEPVLLAMGKKVVYCGAAGPGLHDEDVHQPAPGPDDGRLRRGPELRAAGGAVPGGHAGHGLLRALELRHVPGEGRQSPE